MGRLSRRAGTNRLAVIVGIGAVLGIAWLILGDHGVELIERQRVDASVIQIVHGESRQAAPGKNGVAIVLVELPDGGRAQVFAPLREASEGGTIPVTVKRFSDGSREVTAAGSAGPD